VDDSSPIWTYTGPWIDTDTGDPATPSYQDATFHATNQTVRLYPFFMMIKAYFHHLGSICINFLQRNCREARWCEAWQSRMWNLLPLNTMG
jgi:hypothetical protein